MPKHQRNVKPELRRFAETFAGAILAEDYKKAHSLFAPFLQALVSPTQLQRYIEQELHEMAEIWELDPIRHPRNFTLDWNSGFGISDLRETDARQRNEPLIYGLKHPEVTLSPDITEENYRAWMVIEFLPDEEDGVEFDAYFDWWMAVIELSGENRVGYFEIHEPD